jgi:hypothetical protein
MPLWVYCNVSTTDLNGSASHAAASRDTFFLNASAMKITMHELPTSTTAKHREPSADLPGPSLNRFQRITALTLLFFLAFLNHTTSSALAQNVPQQREWIDARLPDLLNTYTYLHQHPEVSFAEHETAKFIAQAWRDAGFAVTENVGGLESSPCWKTAKDHWSCCAPIWTHYRLPKRPVCRTPPSKP